MKRITLNADVGEGAGFDKEIMPYISWCNISCGSHAGSEKVIQETIDLAIKNDVKIGAHPSYPDRPNFGRVVMNLEYQELVGSITEQIRLVKYYTEQKGQKLHHIKPHGALYNHSIKNEEVASAIIESVKNVDKSLKIITLKTSKIVYLCQGVLDVKFEAFADRNYNEDLSLVSRLENEAVISNPIEVFNHVCRMVSDGVIKTKTGEKLPVFFDTICVHGDTLNAVQILRYLHNQFSNLDYKFK